LAYQSLYRRFRPQRFAEVLGQEHVTRALRAAVAAGTVGHAYLFSGPRGTGKTSTARILAKALNCERPDDGEPCLACASCIEIGRGGSDVVEELDAASNSGVDAMRWLIQTVATASSGKRKVYIIDEVHMLTVAASNALLKTLEEPPEHVVFILATTNPQKVLPTVVSRTQHFAFHLLDDRTLAELVDQVVEQAGLELDAATRAWVRARGQGSARDTLSVLEQVAAGGEVPRLDGSIEEAARALLSQDPARVVSLVEELLARGSDPVWVQTELLAQLKRWLLADLTGEGAPFAGPVIARAMERLGRLAVGVRDALDPGVVLEAALVGLATELERRSALEERLAALEREVAALSQGARREREAPTEGTPRRGPGPDVERLRNAITVGGRAASRDPAAPRALSPSQEAPRLEATAAPAAPREAPAPLDAASTEHLRARIQSEWLSEVIPSVEPQRARVWARDTRVAALGPGRLAIVVDHATRLEKLKPHEAGIVGALQARYGDGFTVEFLLESALKAEAVPEAAGDEPSEPEVVEDRAEVVRAEELTEEVIARNVARVFPEARRIERKG
jgi:DNA polymerase-3 subunit gamma/tau